MRGDKLSRRDFIKVIALSSFSSFYGCKVYDPKTTETFQINKSLNEALVKKGCLFGSSFDMAAAVRDPAYGELIKHHCGVLTTDFSLKFGALRNKESYVDFSRSDKLIEFANNAHIPLKGHTLIWNEWNPDWLNQSSSKKRRYWLERHIVEVMGRYEGAISSWDVVNEPFWPDHGYKGGYRSGPWFKAFGKSYIERAFKVAASVDQGAKLFLNEAWVERDDALGQRVRGGLLSLIEELLESGCRLDGVGLQCHLQPGKFNLATLSRFIEELKRFPIEVHISELDVNDYLLHGSVEQVDAQVAQIYSDFFRVVLPHDNVKSVITWQLSDKYTYMKDSRAYPRPLLFDYNFNPKDAYFKALDTINTFSVGEF